MAGFSFDAEYNKYWKNRVEKSIDGTKVADNEVVDGLTADLHILKSDKVLDLGCGYGRSFPVLEKYSSEIYGIDIDISMVNDASKFNYRSLHAAKAEDTRFPDNYFDKLFVFGVFDVVEQELGIIEFNRILKEGGRCLVTGKNIDYFEDDEKALVAEKNARAKNFPNHFTDVKKLIEDSNAFGFFCEKLIVFPRRGDFGDNKKVEITDFGQDFTFYEYCIFLRKEHPIQDKPEICFANGVSNTAKRLGII